MINNINKEIEKHYYRKFASFSGAKYLEPKSCEEHIFFVTMKMAKSWQLNGDIGARAIWRQFDRFYIGACREAMGNRFKYYPDRQPFAYAFIDIAGSRDATLRLNRDRIYCDPHIHAIIMVHPKYLQEFHRVFDRLDRGGSLEGNAGAKFKISAYDQRRSSLSDLISYSRKGLVLLRHENEVENYWNVYPRIISRI